MKYKLILFLIVIISFITIVPTDSFAACSDFNQCNGNAAQSCTAQANCGWCQGDPDIATGCYQVGTVTCDTPNAWAWTSNQCSSLPNPGGGNPGGGNGNAACSNSCGACSTTTTCGQTTYDTCIDNRGQSGSSMCSNGATGFRCYASGNNNCISGSSNSDFNYSCNACNSGGGTPPANDCGQRTSCGACILNAQCAWRGSLSGSGGSCVTDTFNYSCPAGETNLYPASCTAGGNVCAATVYDITGRVTEGSVGIGGAVVCLDPTYPDCSDVTVWKATTNASGNYTIRSVTNGGSGHNVFLSPSSIGNRVPNSSNTVHLSATTNANQTVNFTATTIQGTGNSPATATRIEQCKADGSGWDLVAQNVCSNLCSSTPPVNTCNSPYVCAANPPQATGCSVVTTPGVACTAAGQSCWTCVPPQCTGSGCGGGPTCGNGVCSGSETCSSCPQDCGTCPSNNPTQPWIQTSGGDVHSNTNIDVP